MSTFANQGTNGIAQMMCAPASPTTRLVISKSAVVDGTGPTRFANASHSQPLARLVVSHRMSKTPEVVVATCPSAKIKFVN